MKDFQIGYEPTTKWGYVIVRALDFTEHYL